MATASASIVLRHIRSFAAAEQAGQLPDRLLLERFTSAGEQRAFAALVRRHGPLVLGVCRRVLGNWHDAEDAFQATFLVLARKAGSISKQESLASWLYQVAYHAALKARAQAAARLKHEQRAGREQPPDPLDELTGRELLAVLDEELLRLPERYRAPLVLCFLEGNTRDQAARQLGWSLRTLRRRVDEAKTLLAKRLMRRGLTLSAGLLAVGLAENTAMAAVPALLVNNTVKAGLLAATGKAMAAGIVSAPVAALADGLLKTMVASKIKIAAALLVAFGVTALGIGMATHQAFAQRQTDAVAAANEQDKPAARSLKADKQPPPAAARPAADAKQKIAVAGRVLDETGKPLPDADIGLVGVPKDRNAGMQWLDGKPLVQTKAKADGRFRLAVNRDSLDKYQRLYVLGGKMGRGVNWERVPLETPGAEVTLRLPAEKIIRGRLLDLQGQPAAGVSVRVTGLTVPSGGEVGGVWVGVPKDVSAFWPVPVTTDKEGNFTLGRLNPRHRGWLHMESDRFAPQEVAIKSDAEKVQVVNLSLAPAQIIEGVVTAADTGKPIPLARLKVNADNNLNNPEAIGPGISGQADDKGRFRLNPPPGKMYTVRAESPGDQPYLRSKKNLIWPKGAVRQEVRLDLPRGVLVRGRVTEAGSGKPVAGAMVRDTVGLWINPTVATGPDGRFRIVVAPDRGRLVIKGPDNDYIAREITFRELEGGKPHGYRVYPDALVSLDLKADAEPQEMTVQLRRGLTIRGTLLGPDGKPAADALMLCWSQVPQHAPVWHAAAVPVVDGRFELRGCDPERAYTVHFLDAKNQRGATVKLSVKEAGGKLVKVRLEPCGSAEVRFVDNKGKPRADFRPIFYIVVRPEPGGSPGLEADADFVSNVDRLHYSGGGSAVDAGARCKYPALIPGATYRILGYDLRSIKDFTVKSGETLKLGDIVIARPQ